ncbi:MAG TPA: hypothetical protein VK605_03625 [Solirubrobacteraceae bacterium]|nr:hypothetical protein [Solirubrobacteraceae bacterium]
MNGVREAFYNMRYRWPGERVGGPGAAMRGQWVILSLSMLVVFAGSFAVGRVINTHTSSAVTGAAAPFTQAGPGPNAIPVGLSGDSPIAGAVPAAVAVRPRPRPIARRASEPHGRSGTSAGPLGSQTAGGEAPTSESQPATAPAPETTPAPSKAPAPAQHSGGSGQNGSAGGGSRPSGAVTFDSSQ